jgi:hypothetical protein
VVNNQPKKTLGNDDFFVSTITLEDGTKFLLSKMTTFQIQPFCKNVGVPSCCTRTKFECMMFFANYITYHGDKLNTKLKPSKYANRLTNKICRISKIVFDEKIIDDFKTVNNIKIRKYHESRKTYNNFWINTTKAYNSCIAINRKDNPKLPVQMVANENESVSGN